MKQVSEQEFNKFLDDYPNELRTTMVRICEPPEQYWLDGSIQSDHKVGTVERFMDEAVAKVTKSYYPGGEFNQEGVLSYFIKVQK